MKIVGSRGQKGDTDPNLEDSKFRIQTHVKVSNGRMVAVFHPKRLVSQFEGSRTDEITESSQSSANLLVRHVGTRVRLVNGSWANTVLYPLVTAHCAAKCRAAPFPHGHCTVLRSTTLCTVQRSDAAQHCTTAKHHIRKSAAQHRTA
jgi:hypothetical protein